MHHNSCPQLFYNPFSQFGPQQKLYLLIHIIKSSAEVDQRRVIQGLASFVDTKNFVCLLLGGMSSLNTRPPMAPNNTELLDRTEHSTMKTLTIDNCPQTGPLNLK